MDRQQLIDNLNAITDELVEGTDIKQFKVIVLTEDYSGDVSYESIHGAYLADRQVITHVPEHNLTCNRPEHVFNIFNELVKVFEL
ncbi:MAG: hypothetical protein [Bacteriophage sp.]|nr:MAG: hypothetical protein [Bacteriophage sp.]